MGREFPKNVKQIGNVCSEPKIYVEDYVDTYLNQLCDKVQDQIICAALTGERVEQNEQNAVYVSGALEIREIEMAGNELIIPDETWERLCDEKELFFEGQEIVGWCLVENGHSQALQKGICKLHDRLFPQENTVFIWKEALGKEEVYYVRKYDELMEIGGHYIFYEKNPSMQNFLITSRKKIGVTPSEMVEDRAAKDFRVAIKEKLEEKQHRRNSRFAYGLSVALVLVVLGIGISTMNNYDKMESVQSSLDSLTQSMGQSEVRNVDAREKEEGTKGQAENENNNTEVKEEETDDEEDRGEGEGEGDIKEAWNPNDEAEELTPVDDASENPKEVTEDAENAESENYYTVCRGDTLDKISLRFYGSTSRVDEICELNKLRDGNLIIIGQKLLLP